MLLVTVSCEMWITVMLLVTVSCEMWITVMLLVTVSCEMWITVIWVVEELCIPVGPRLQILISLLHHKLTLHCVNTMFVTVWTADTELREERRTTEAGNFFIHSRHHLITEPAIYTYNGKTQLLLETSSPSALNIVVREYNFYVFENPKNLTTFFWSDIEKKL